MAALYRLILSQGSSSHAVSGRRSALREMPSRTTFLFYERAETASEIISDKCSFGPHGSTTSTLATIRPCCSVNRRGAANWLRLDCGGPVIVLPEAFYEQGSLLLYPGDVMLAYTDRISEAIDSAEQEWGEEGMILAAQQGCDRAANRTQGAFPNARSGIDPELSARSSFAAGGFRLNSRDYQEFAPDADYVCRLRTGHLECRSSQSSELLMRSCRFGDVRPSERGHRRNKRDHPLPGLSSAGRAPPYRQANRAGRLQLCRPFLL
jgi:hypothetical protein